MLRRKAILFGLTLLALVDPALAAQPFDCGHNHCGFMVDRPYPNFVIGRIDGIATPVQTARFFGILRAAGWWQQFPDNAALFAMKMQPISLAIAPGRSLTVMAATDETRRQDLQLGELVRFAPHRGLHETPRPNDPYWVGVGCVALLCAPADAVCRGGFRPGLYRLKDGVALDSTSQRVVPGIAIDTMSMRMKSGAP